MHAIILGRVSQNPVAAALIALAVVLISTLALFSAPPSQHTAGKAGPPSVPGYWLPFLGHSPQFLLNKNGFLAGLRKRYLEGMFSLKMMGKKHHITHEPALSSALMNRPRTSYEEGRIAIRMLTASFGLGKQDQTTCTKLAHETPDLFKHMLSEPGLSNLVDAMVDQVKTRTELFRARGLPLEARASCHVALSWAMNANADPLIFWLVLELYRDPVLLEMVREEIAPFSKVAQPGNECGSAVWIAPELESLDLDGLINHCPHLKAAYLEILDVYTGVWTVEWLTEDVTLE